MILSAEKQQFNKIKNQAIDKLLVVDLDLNGYDASSSEDFVKLGYNATKNKVLFWLNMILGDVVRSTQASPLVRLLGKQLNDENKRNFETDISNGFDDIFATEGLKLANIQLESNPNDRSWFLSMTVLDNVTDSLIPINLEVIS